mgnify:CR=1 FL=1
MGYQTVTKWYKRRKNEKIEKYQEIIVFKSCENGSS